MKVLHEKPFHRAENLGISWIRSECLTPLIGWTEALIGPGFRRKVSLIPTISQKQRQTTESHLELLLGDFQYEKGLFCP